MLIRYLRGHGFFIFLVVVLSGFAFYTYRSSEKQENEKKQALKVFGSLSLSEVHEVEVVQGPDPWQNTSAKGNAPSARDPAPSARGLAPSENERTEGESSGAKSRAGFKPDLPASFRLVQEGKLWHLKRGGSQWEDWADPRTVRDWLGRVLAEEAPVLEDKKEISWGEYGLEEDYNTLSLKGKRGQGVKLRISRLSAFDGKFFLRRNNTLLLGGVIWGQLKSRGIKFFRSRRLVPFNRLPRDLSFHSGDMKWSFTYRKGEWKWSEDIKNPPFPLLSHSLRSYWQELLDLRLQMEEDIPPDTPPMRKKHQLLSPQLSLQSRFQEGEQWSLKLGSEKQGVLYAVVSGRKHLLPLTENEAQKLFLNSEKLRDHEQPFQFQESEVSYMEFQSEALSLKLKKKKGQWTLESPQAKNPELNVRWPGQVLNHLRNLKVQNYVGQKKITPQTEVTLRDSKNQLLLHLQMESSAGADKTVFVKTHKGQEVMTLLERDFQTLSSFQPFQKDRPEEDPASDQNPSKKTPPPANSETPS